MARGVMYVCGRRAACAWQITHWVGGDDTPTRVVDALSHHVHPKKPFFLLEHLLDPTRRALRRQRVEPSVDNLVDAALQILPRARVSKPAVIPRGTTANTTTATAAGELANLVAQVRDALDNSLQQQEMQKVNRVSRESNRGGASSVQRPKEVV
jgi:hypothetical protein